MNYKKLFGFGILIYIIVFVLASAFVAYGAVDSLALKIIILLAIAITAYLAAREVRVYTAGQMLKYSIVWAIIVALLDVVMTVPFTGWEVFQEWTVWLGYAIIIFVPLIAIKR